MLLTIRTTHRPATDLGFLLHKHPEHVHTRDFPFGNATVFYPEAAEDTCTAAIVLDVDPVGMVRGRGGKGGGEDQYVNDRPYVASSLVSVVLSRWFNSALGGRCERKPELAATPLPLEARIAAVPCRGGEGFLRALFEPLGYEVEANRHELDESMPALGPSRLFTVTLRSTRRLSELLTHLYVLIPVLDDQKHYWVGDDEVEKLLRHGEGWLHKHPSRDVIVSRYLVHQRGLVRDAIARMTAEEQPEEETVAAQKDEQEAKIDRTISLNERRLDAVVDALKASGAARVLDLGCGEGKLLRRLLSDHQFSEIVGMDVASRTLDHAESRLKLDRLASKQRERIRLLHGSLVYRDARLSGFDAAAVVEVVEHLDQPPSPRLRTSAVRGRKAGRHSVDDPERRVQREVAVTAGRPVPPSGSPVTGPASARKAAAQETAVHAESSSCGAQEHSLRFVGVHVVLMNDEEPVLRTVPRLQLPRHAK